MLFLQTILYHLASSALSHIKRVNFASRLIFVRMISADRLAISHCISSFLYDFYGPFCMLPHYLLRSAKVRCEIPSQVLVSHMIFSMMICVCSDGGADEDGGIMDCTDLVQHFEDVTRRRLTRLKTSLKASGEATPQSASTLAPKSPGQRSSLTRFTA